MSIRTALSMMQKLADDNGISKPYVVGGTVRDYYLPGPIELADVDITTGSDDASSLAKLFADEIGKPLEGKNSDHYFVHYNDVKYDFSTNFRYPNIDALLKEKGINNPSELQKETFSRDFTINTLLRDTSFTKQLDLTGRGVSDINSRILTCPLSCELSMSSNPRRILRAYYFKAKYGFIFSEELKLAIAKTKSALETVNRRYASEMLNKIVREDENMIDILIENGVFNHVSLTKYVTDILIKKRKLVDVL